MALVRMCAMATGRVWGDWACWVWAILCSIWPPKSMNRSCNRMACHWETQFWPKRNTPICTDASKRNSKLNISRVVRHSIQCASVRHSFNRFVERLSHQSIDQSIDQSVSQCSVWICGTDRSINRSDRTITSINESEVELVEWQQWKACIGVRRAVVLSPFFLLSFPSTLHIFLSSCRRWLTVMEVPVWLVMMKMTMIVNVVCWWWSCLVDHEDDSICSSFFKLTSELSFLLCSCVSLSACDRNGAQATAVASVMMIGDAVWRVNAHLKVWMIFVEFLLPLIYPSHFVWLFVFYLLESFCLFFSS